MSVLEGAILRMVVSNIYTDGGIIQNVFNAVVSDGSPPYDADDIAEDALAWAADLFFNLTSRATDTLDGSQVQVYEYDPVDDDWDEVGTKAFVWNPSASAEAMPRGTALLINAKTTDPDVSGKKYIGGLTVNDIADGLLTSTIITAAASFAVDWYDPFTGTVSGALWTPGIWSVKNTNFFMLTGTVIIGSVVAYQRRRKRGVGI